MPVIAETTQYRRARANPDPNPEPQLSRSKPTTISSLLTQTLTLTPPNKNKKNTNFATLRGLGCAAAAAHVSVPAAIRSAADWDTKKNNSKIRVSKKKVRRNSKSIGIVNPTAEVCCGPGIGLSTDAASVDCVVRRERGRLKIDVEKTNQRERERPLCSTRRMVNPELTSFMDSEHSMEEAIHSRFDVFGGSRYNRHVRHPSPEGFAEIMMFHSSLMMGGRSERFDRYRELRLDVDHMSYEDLLELGDRIGHVNTGLKEDEIVDCLKKTKFLSRMLSHFPTEMEGKCSICQEDYEEEDEIGKLECGHFYHIDCVKQWLARRNACPICKTAAATQ